MQRRGRLEIWMAILKTIDEETRRGRGAARPTRVRSAANLSTARLRAHVEAMSDCGFLAADALRLTAKGREYLQQARLLERMGTESTDEDTAALAVD